MEGPSRRHPTANPRVSSLAYQQDDRISIRVASEVGAIRRRGSLGLLQGTVAPGTRFSAAKPIRAEPLGGNGQLPLILGQIPGRFTMRQEPARRVGSSVLLGGELNPSPRISD